MAKLFKKVMLKVGDKHAPAGTVHVTPEQLQHWSRECARMKRNKQVVPIDWDHAAKDEDLQPVSLSEYKQRLRSSQTTVGRLHDFRLAPDGQGAEITLDVRSPHAIEQAELNNVFVSPVIVPYFKDGSGNEYRNIIGHVDFVNYPVDHDQSDFIPVEQGSIACSLRMAGQPIIRLSRDADMADEKDDEKDEKEDETDLEGGDELESPPVEPEAALPEQPEPEPIPTSVKEVLAALAQHDIILPNDTTEANFLDRVHSALLTAHAHKSKADEPPAGPLGETKVVDDTQGIAAMSLRLSSMEAALAEQHKTAVEGRLKKLRDTGRCTPAEYKDKGGLLGAVKLSLTDKGKPIPSEVEKWIDSREVVPAGTFWDAQARTRLSAVVNPPEDPTGGMSQEEIDNKANWALGRKTG